MKRLSWALVSSLVVLLNAAALRAQPAFCSLTNRCDFCVASQGISPIEMGRSGVRFDIRYLTLSTPFADGIRQPSDGESESHLTNQITFMFYVNPWFSMSLMVPYVHRSSNEQDAQAPTAFSSLTNSGIGDLVALARIKLLSDTKGGTTKMIAATGGLKLATGSTDKRDAEGELADAHMQLGTGTWDPALGMSVLFGQGHWAIASNVLATFPTAANSEGHRFGNNLNYDATLRYRVFELEDAAYTLFATGGIAGEWRAKETVNGEPDANSGGNVTYFAPGLQFFLSDFTSIEANYQLPIAHNLNGDQLGESYRVTAGLQYLF